MHCPHCREDNAPMTRFCTSCGAVLVEEAPGGGRRRVLRPWGLRREAPLTVSPDVVGPPARATPSRARSLRRDLWLAGGVVGVVAIGAGAYPAWRSDAVPRATLAPVEAVHSVVALPSPARVRETSLASPALVEPRPPRAPAASHSVASAATAPAPAPPPAARASPPRAVGPVAVGHPFPLVRDAPAGDGEGVAASPEPPVAAAAPAPPSDRWQALREQLAGCQSLGLLERAMCEQGARLAHCDGHWGQVAACPAGRTEYGQ